MNAVVLAEGAREWGTGHMVRCLSLSQALVERDFEVHWLLVGDAIAEKFLHDHGLRGTVLPRWDRDSIVALAGGAEMVVVDGYHVPDDIYADLSKRIPSRLWIDDLCNRNYPQGFVLNSSPAAARIRPQGFGPGTTPLLGSRYHPLRTEFLPPPQRVTREEFRRVLVLVGGTDPLGLTPRLLEVLHHLDSDFECVAVVPQDEQREAWTVAAPLNSRLLPQRTAEQLRDLLEWCDLVVTAGGQTLLECLRMEVPTIAIRVADNQRELVACLAEAGRIIDAGDARDSDALAPLPWLVESLRPAEVRRKLAAKASGLVDGKGASRAIADTLGLSMDLRLRLARAPDSEAVLEITNDPAVRFHSLDPAPIPADRHREWFPDAIADQDLLFLVAVDESSAVRGQLRYRREGDTLVPSISLSASVRGRGEGSKLLREGDRLAFRHFPATRRIAARIDQRNLASLRSFQAAGYRIDQHAPAAGTFVVLSRPRPQALLPDPPTNQVPS